MIEKEERRKYINARTHTSDEATHRIDESSQTPKQEINLFDEFINIPKKEIHLNYTHTLRHTHTQAHINIKTNRLEFEYHSISILANISNFIAIDWLVLSSAIC